MFGKLSILYTVLQHGNELADKSFWKKQQSYTVPIVAGVLIAAVQFAQAFGIHIPLNPETCTWIAGIIYAAVNLWLTLATSSSVGIPFQGNDKPEPTLYAAIDNPSPAAYEDVAKAIIVEKLAPVVKLDAYTLTAASAWLKKNARK